MAGDKLSRSCMRSVLNFVEVRTCQFLVSRWLAALVRCLCQFKLCALGFQRSRNFEQLSLVCGDAGNSCRDSQTPSVSQNNEHKGANSSSQNNEHTSEPNGS